MLACYWLITSLIMHKTDEKLIKSIYQSQIKPFNWHFQIFIFKRKLPNDPFKTNIIQTWAERISLCVYLEPFTAIL